ncbi:MAG: hypothetical protein ACI92E_000328 [Oceanicoccus sp.]|jgi:hypothetical protein
MVVGGRQGTLKKRLYKLHILGLAESIALAVTDTQLEPNIT